MRARIEGADATTIAEEFIAHARDSHDRPYPEDAKIPRAEITRILGAMK